jgi:hypothetical protein
VAFAVHFLHHVKENLFFYSVIMKRKYRAENVFILFFLYKYNTIQEKWI